MKPESRTRAHGGTPVVPLCALGCQRMFSSEEEETVSFKNRICKEKNLCDRLLAQQAAHLQEKEVSREANNFCLKSCLTNWVHLNLPMFLIKSTT
jgi:hypothetical protein